MKVDSQNHKQLIQTTCKSVEDVIKNNSANVLAIFNLYGKGNLDDFISRSPDFFQTFLRELHIKRLLMPYNAEFVLCLNESDRSSEIEKKIKRDIYFKQVKIVSKTFTYCMVEAFKDLLPELEESLLMENWDFTNKIGLHVFDTLIEQDYWPGFKMDNVVVLNKFFLHKLSYDTPYTVIYYKYCDSEREDTPSGKCRNYKCPGEYVSLDYYILLTLIRKGYLMKNAVSFVLCYDKSVRKDYYEIYKQDTLLFREQVCDAIAKYRNGFQQVLDYLTNDIEEDLRIEYMKTQKEDYFNEFTFFKTMRVFE